ncbi:AMP-binding protein [Streptomyces morookaense]|uniref:AMP-binding protein n=1 Tax=Streptomyces morookaense TaxID=1970 RepID=A0A7Y7E736_STRMO|nr:AMP-binding protein [Streptomyces morookaense]NVK77822.1 AMP-binding protein [Streptomyces morookaense]
MTMTMSPRTAAGTLTDMLSRSSASRPDAVFCTYLPDAVGGRAESLGLAALDRRARQVAALLRTRVQRGDRVLLAFPNGPEFAAAFFGCLYAGAVAVPVPAPRGPVRASLYAAVEADCRPALVCTVPGWLPLFASRPGSRSGAVVAIGPPTGRSAEPVPAEASDLAYVQYTPRSFGPPRAVPVTHGAALAGLSAFTAETRLGARDRLVGWLPAHDGTGLTTQVLLPLFTGMSTWALPSGTVARDPRRWLAAMSQQRATTGVIPPGALDLPHGTDYVQRCALQLGRWRLVLAPEQGVDGERLDAFIGAYAVAGFWPDAVVRVPSPRPSRPVARRS